MAKINDEIIHAGELNRLVEFLKPDYVKNASNEMELIEKRVCQKFAKREEVSGNSSEEFNLVRSHSLCRFIIRFDQDILINGKEYVIRDVDGDYYVNSVSVLSRNRFLICQAERRDAGD